MYKLFITTQHTRPHRGMYPDSDCAKAGAKLRKKWQTSKSFQVFCLSFNEIGFGSAKLISGAYALCLIVFMWMQESLCRG